MHGDHTDFVLQEVGSTVRPTVRCDQLNELCGKESYF